MRQSENRKAPGGKTRGYDRVRSPNMFGRLTYALSVESANGAAPRPRLLLAADARGEARDA